MPLSALFGNNLTIASLLPYAYETGTGLNHYVLQSSMTDTSLSAFMTTSAGASYTQPVFQEYIEILILQKAAMSITGSTMTYALNCMFTNQVTLVPSATDTIIYNMFKVPAFKAQTSVLETTRLTNLSPLGIAAPRNK